MADIWEQAVEIYLAMDRGLFLNPQYLIGTPMYGKPIQTFLLLEFPERRAWMIEVTKAPRTFSCSTKSRRLRGSTCEGSRNNLQSIK